MTDKLTRSISDLLDAVGDSGREGLEETPARAAKAWQFWCGGYEVDPIDLLKTFEDGAEHYDEMVLVKDIPFYSHCEHHLAAIIGRATVAYIPNRRIVGLSKLSRVVDAYARRLQVQERLTRQVAECIETGLQPLGVAVQGRARHLCMESRGVRQQGHSTTTQALLGAFKTNPETRAEFLKLAHSEVPL